MGERVPSRSMLSYMRIHMESASHNALLLPLLTAAVPLTGAATAPGTTPLDVAGLLGRGECSSSDEACPLDAETSATPAGAEGAGSSHGTVDGIVARRKERTTLFAQHARRPAQGTADDA